jgi:hypothetical protein
VSVDIIIISGQSGANVITPTQNSQQQQQQLPTRRSSRLFGSTQSVKENSKALSGKSGRISSSVKSPSRKSKPRLLQRTAEQQQHHLSEIEKNEKNKCLLSSENKLIRDKVSEVSCVVITELLSCIRPCVCSKKVFEIRIKKSIRFCNKKNDR